MSSYAVQLKAGKKWKKQHWLNFFLALPFVLYMILFRYVPLGGWVLSLYDYKPGIPVFRNTFIGLDNFRYFFTAGDVFRSLKNTLIFSGIGILTTVLAPIFAILLNEINNKPYRRIVQTLSTVPHFMSWIICYSLVFALFSTEGLINTLLEPLGISQSILTNKNAVYWFQTTLNVWKGIGWNAIVYIAAITGIDQELYEAATVDGAGRIRCAWHITVPGIMPTYLVLFLLGFANLLNTGTDQHFVFRNPLIMDTLETIDLYVYRVGLQLFQYSFAIAVGILKSIVSIGLLFFMNGVAKKIRGEGIV
jgi:ABC-type polysaccharide transport system permease subunit